MNLSPAITRRAGIAAAVFVTAFLTTYLSFPTGVGVDTVTAALLAGISALAHWAVNQLQPVVELGDAHAAVQDAKVAAAKQALADAARPASVPSAGTPPSPAADSAAPAAPSAPPAA